MGTRAIVSLANGAVSAELWLMGAMEEAPVSGNPTACSACPLRSGGDWEVGAAKALRRIRPEGLSVMKRWGCHAKAVPCAGMRRLISRIEEKRSNG